MDNTPINEVTIVDINGKIMLESAGEFEGHLNVEQLQPGIYLVLINSDNQIITKKFVKE